MPEKFMKLSIKPHILLALFTTLLSLSSYTAADELTDLLTGKPAAKVEAPANKVISVANTHKSDREIRNRLREIFAELESLKKLSIEVNKGVVTLKGEVTTAAEESKALTLSKQVEGVVEVVDEVQVTRSVEKRLETTGKKALTLGSQIVTTLPLFLLALFVFVITWIIGRWISKRQGFFRHIAPNAFIANLLGQITHLIFIIFGLVLALSLLDATALLGTIMGAAGIFGLAIGFAVRDTVENYIASILLSLRNPFQVNDYVDINGNQGNVARLTTRATILISSDGNHVRIPNAEVFKAVIVNYTRNPERRFTFDLGVDAAEDLNEAQQLAIETLNAIEGVMDDPKPNALVQELGDFNVLVRVYGWVDQEHYSFSKVRSEAIKRCKKAFDDAGIIMPEPIYQVRLSDSLEKLSGVTLQQKQRIKSKKAKSKLKDQQVSDVKPDDTARDKVEEEYADGDSVNLLSKETPSE
jgi:small-conductance mechanosensitive channel